MTSCNWREVARRIVAGVDVQTGDVVIVRDSCGRYDVLQEVLLAVEEAGAFPIPHIMPARYLERLWQLAPLEYLERWDHHRDALVEAAKRIIVLGGDRPDFSGADAASLNAWNDSLDRLTGIEEALRLPYLVAGLPTAKRAYHLDMTLDTLDALLMPAMCVTAETLTEQIRATIAHVQHSDGMILRSGANCELLIRRGSRPWLADDGRIDREDLQRGAIVSNLPAGSAYCAPLEDASDGSLFLPKLSDVRNVTLFFKSGRICEISAPTVEAREQLRDWLDSFSGEARRISHIGIGANPALKTPIGWTLIDEHIQGRVFIALGENRYMNGENASSLNHDEVLDADAHVLSSSI
jgi:leucyl aminopeptidase (aminopeptidase T)